MNKSRLVLDTNLVISAALMERSFARQVFEIALTQGEILISDETQDELTEVLMRPKFDRYISEEQRLLFLANFLQLAVSVEVTQQISACRDPKDDKFLELAVNGNADCIVTGDKDLLVLHPFEGVAILTLTEFRDRYTQS
ncbi:MAG: putative toxin-antitoxin system toxin component, PIN family [Caldilineaceae bacterium]|nr:putative toxin-antitoxin system toxin component, PIN family [Caldilineaceae bacterium]